MFSFVQQEVVLICWKHHRWARAVRDTGSDDRQPVMEIFCSSRRKQALTTEMI